MPEQPRPPRRPVDLITGEPLAGLARWVAEGAVDAAARTRARTRWLERQASEEASMAGVLLDLAERREGVLLSTRGGATLRGFVVAIGADFVVVRDVRQGDTFVPLAAAALVRPAPGDGSPRPDAPSGDRPVGYELVLAQALVELSAEGPAIRAVVGGTEVRGTLRSAGFDVAAVQLGGDRRDVVHLAVDAIDHLVVLTT